MYGETKHQPEENYVNTNTKSANKSASLLNQMELHILLAEERRNYTMYLI